MNWQDEIDKNHKNQQGFFKQMENKMITVNSLSGGKTSSYIAANYPADYNVFSLVRTNDKDCMFPDKKVRQIVSDRIGTEFIGTLEDDLIVYTMLDLEQYIGQKIHWVTGDTFDDVITERNGNIYIPQATMRKCTSEMKVIPIAKFWLENINTPCQMRIGFRANEVRRANNMIKKLNKNGLHEEKLIVGKHKNGNNKWKTFEWRKPVFPLIKDGIFKDKIVEYWKDKPVRFAKFNNCIGCFHAEPMFLNMQSKRHPSKFDWFIRQEQQSMIDYKGRTWLMGDLTYEQIKNYKQQTSLFNDDDFNECDSGYCGL